LQFIAACNSERIAQISLFANVIVEMTHGSRYKKPIVCVAVNPGVVFTATDPRDD